MTHNINLFVKFFRSPWVQCDELPIRLQQMERLANKAFDTYRQLYYDGGISSVYFWPTSNDDTDGSSSFGGAILIKKAVEQETYLTAATWDSSHVVEVSKPDDGSFLIQMTSTVLLDIKADFTGIDDFNLGGSMTRLNESNVNVANDTALLAAIGKIVEEIEGRMRSALQEIYFGKTLEIVNDLRPSLPDGYLRNQEEFRDDLMQRLHK